MGERLAIEREGDGLKRSSIRSSWFAYGDLKNTEKQNRSYFCKKNNATNYSDLERILPAVENIL